MLLLVQIIILLIVVVALRACKISFHPFEVMFFIFVTVFISSITMAPDVENYMTAYSYKYYVAKDSGFGVAINVGKKLGLNFYEFKDLYLFICSVILFSSLKLILPNMWTVLPLYFLYPFLLNVVQIRNYFVISVVLFAFSVCSHLIGKKIVYPLWVFFILIASTQHKIALVFLPFVLVWNRDRFLFKLVLVMFAISILFQFYAQSHFSSLMLKGLLLIDESNRINAYEERASHYGVFLLMFESLCMFYIAQKMVYLNGIARYFGNVFFVNKNYEIVRYIRNFFLYGALFWPLYIWGGSFARLMQCQYVLLFVLIVLCGQMILFYPEQLKKVLLVNDSIIKVLIVFVIIFTRNCCTIWFSLFELVVDQIFSNLNFLFAYFQS